MRDQLARLGYLLAVVTSLAGVGFVLGRLS